MKRMVLAALLVVWLTSSPGYGQDKNLVVVLETNLGTIKIALFEKKSPLTVKNFLKHVDEKFYDGTIFHRVQPPFLIQGGGFAPGFKEKTTRTTIKNESNNDLSNARGTIAMARTPEPDSASTQFFINVKDNPFLDRKKVDDEAGYCVFGKVIEGMDVVDKISTVKTNTRNGYKNVPVEDVVIRSVKRAK